ncbi:MAG: hypothetical protein JWP58_3282 [Hymenobacter sp.]|nr:hypothetical protein [Hymenobacter sp.]
MSTVFSLTLSDLPSVAEFIAERAARSETWAEGFDDVLNHDDGAKLAVQVLREVLDEWLQFADWQKHNADAFTDPFKFLAATDHIEVVQKFRDVLGEDLEMMFG